MTPFALPAGVAQIAAQPPEPFVYGKGGKRMTPEQIAREREIANAMMGVDYSPVYSPWQGLARVSENIRGALGKRKADKAEQANMDYSDQILESLTNPGGVPSATGAPGVASPAPGANLNQLAAIISDPYVSESVKAIAGMQLEQQQRMAFKQFERESAPPEIREDNAGNQWAINPVTGEKRLLLWDPTPKIDLVPGVNAAGERVMHSVNRPNMVNQDGSIKYPGAPPVGTVVDGRPFLGGDPTSKESWGEMVPAPSISEAPPRVSEQEALAKARAEGDEYMRKLLGGQ